MDDRSRWNYSLSQDLVELEGIFPAEDRDTYMGPTRRHNHMKTMVYRLFDVLSIRGPWSIVPLAMTCHQLDMSGVLGIILQRVIIELFSSRKAD